MDVNEESQSFAHFLSPAATHPNRRWGRFAYQISSDVFSFGQNLPIRILLVDRLEALPSIFSEVFKRNEFKILLGKADEQFSKIDAKTLCGLSNLQIKAALKFTHEILSNLSARGSDNHVIVDACTNFESWLADQKLSPKLWWGSLLLALPHVERDVWLTEMSSPLPVHAMMRMHDVWALKILLWCYQSWGAVSQAGDSVKLDTQQPLKFMEMNDLSVRLLDGWSCAAKLPDSAQAPLAPHSVDHRCSIVVGPIYIPSLRPASEPDSLGQPWHGDIASDFRYFMGNAAKHIPTWEDKADALPSEEELNHAIAQKTRLGKAELAMRLDSIVSCYATLRNLGVDSNVQISSHDDIQNTAGLVMWVQRSNGALAEKNLHLTVRKKSKDASIDGNQAWHYAIDSRWNKNTQRHEHKLTQVKQELLEATAEVIETLKKKNLIDYPAVLFNRVRERQIAYWSNLLLAINNLLHRSHMRHPLGLASWSVPVGEIDNGNLKKSVFDNEMALLAGFGHRLCAYLMSIANANVCTLYRIDYSHEPPLPLVMANHCRNLELRATSDLVANDFEAFLLADQANELHKRSESESLCVRVAATNKHDRWPKLDGTVYLGSQYPSSHEPKSALALPLQYNGRVFGVLELKGLVEDQFSDRLLEPLTRAANLIAPFAYQNLLLREIGAINHLLASEPITAWRDVGEDKDGLSQDAKPLTKISRSLCNVFLCQAVHIWQQDAGSDDRKYKLKAWNHHGMFNRDKEHPVFYLPEDTKESPHKPTVHTAFAFFAAAPFLRSDPSANMPMGTFAQAKYEAGNGSLHTDFSDKELIYKQALGSGLVLRRDFVSAGDGLDSDPSSHLSYRKKIFLPRSIGALSQDSIGFDLKEVMAFALISEAKNQNMHANPISYTRTARDLKQQMVGIITLHAHGDSLNSHVGFSKGWAPVVAYMQTYLANVLEQVDRLEGTHANTRDFLLHEIRNVVLTTDTLVKEVRNELYDFTEKGVVQQARNWQRKLEAYRLPSRGWIQPPAPLHLAGVDAVNLYEGFDRLLRTLAAIKGRIKHNNSLAIAFDTLVKRLEKIDEYATFKALGLANIELPIVFDVVESLRVIVKSHRRGIVSNGRFFELSLGDASLNVKTYDLLWGLILENIISNIIKYAREDSPVSIKLTDGHYLVFSNEGQMEPSETIQQLEQPKQRGAYARSSTAPGRGLGLSVVAMACKFCEIGYIANRKFLGKRGGLNDVSAFEIRLNLIHILTSEKLEES